MKHQRHIFLIISLLLFIENLSCNLVPIQNSENREKKEEPLQELQELVSEQISLYLKKQEGEEKLHSSEALPSLVFNITAIDIAATGYGSSVITNDGKILQWGLGINGTELVLLPPNEIPAKIVGGGYHTLVLTSSGNVYSWGRSPVTLGCCSPSEQGPIIAPRSLKGVLNSKRVASIDAGFEHSVAITDEGKAYCWGINTHGQCGGKQENYWQPRLIKGNSITNKKIVQACCGGYHTILLSDDGNVYSLGWGRYGQLGLGINVNETVTIPTLVENLKNIKIKEISCGGDHTIALSDEGIVYVWGWNEHGQLGLGENITDNQFEPMNITILNQQPIKTICGGQYDHSFAITPNGRVIAWGSNSDGQTGSGDYSTIYVPKEIGGLEYISKIDAGLKHSIALKENGQVITMGDNSYGQLGTTEVEGKVSWMYSISTEKNVRNSMEDYVKVVENFGKPNLAFFGVFDGHGGNDVSQFISEQLPINILDQFLKNSTYEMNENFFKNVYSLTEKQIYQHSIEAVRCGSTAVTVIVEKTTNSCDIHSANVGDSLAILLNPQGEKRIQSLTKSHRPDDIDEATRLSKHGCPVYSKRIRGILAVSRAFGDSMFNKETEVISEPYYQFLQLNPIECQGSYIVLGSDGLFDYLSNEEIADFIEENESKMTIKELTKELVKKAIEQNSTDNVSVVLIKL